MKRVLVSDFDGTMTSHDFYQLVSERLLPAEMPDYWGEYRAGARTHFSALQAIFRSLRVSESELLEVVGAMEFDSGIPSAVERLQKSDWEIVVVSAGCSWYIEKLLGPLAERITVYANPGTFSPTEGLAMEMPSGGEFVSTQLGVDKEGVVGHFQRRGFEVAFAGDGHPDIDAARRVPAAMRFARADLAADLAREGLSFQPFERWTEIAELLLERGV